MLAAPLLPSPTFPEDHSLSQYRPAKDLESFNSLLPPKIEFVEGSSSGALASLEAKYVPINGTPKTPKDDDRIRRPSQSQSTPSKSPKIPQGVSNPAKSLYIKTIATSWPPGVLKGCGLNNTGNTCFLNSALQCLLHTPPLLHVLLAHGTADPCAVPKSAFCMSCAMRQLMMECYKKNHSLTPYMITGKLQHIAKHLRRGRQEDSHEFLRYAVDAMQKSCLAGQPQKIDHALAETTWIHKIFGGRLRSRVTCLSCGYNSDTFDGILDLSIDIYGVADVRAALKKFVAVDHLRGADKYKCEKCKKPVIADKQFTVHEAPMILTIHLKRFSPMGRKIGHPVKYDERISLQPYMSEGQHGHKYTLYGIISHAGGGPNSGHYYAHVKDANGRWWEMNDESVTPGAPQQNSKNAYMLFYIRDQGQILEAAVLGSNRPAVTPQKPSVAASMKKRKVVDSDDEGKRPAPSTPTPFIGPLRPSPASPTKSPLRSGATTKSPKGESPEKSRPSSPLKPSKAFQSLSQYSGDDSDDVGEKVFEPQGSPAPTEELSSPHPHPPPTPLSSKENSTSSLVTTTTTAVPVDSFYAQTPKKRRSREEPSSLGQYARTPLPHSNRGSSQLIRSGISPYARVTGSNNLRGPGSNPHSHRHKKKPRLARGL